MHDFMYVRPRGLSEAVAALAEMDDPKLLAGGMTLLPTMKSRLAGPSTLIDIGNIEELRGIRSDGRTVVVGSMTRHVDVANDASTNLSVPALAKVASAIGDVQVRNRGTIGGSISNNDPSADYPAACVALNANIRTTKRSVPADQFFTGFFSTILDDDEIVVSIEFPSTRRAAYQKFRNKASGYAVVGVMVAETAEGIRVAVTGAGEGGVFRHQQAEDALNHRFDPSALTGIVTPADGIISDPSCSAEYRAHLIDVLTMRAVVDALASGDK